MQVSIIIINYNYEEYLAQSIESALGQSYENVEVIVVDDGSTDGSRGVVEQFVPDVAPVFKSNGGMASACNAGYEVSSGNVIFFLDADDLLLESTVEKVVSVWTDKCAKVHFRLRTVDADLNPIGYNPAMKYQLSEGEVWKEVLTTGSYVTTPTTGNAFSRRALEKHFPIDTTGIVQGGGYFSRVSTDGYLKMRIPFEGSVEAIDQPLGLYRIHGNNYGASSTPYTNGAKRQRYIRLAKKDGEFIQTKAQEKGIICGPDVPFKNSEMLKLRLLSFILDDDHAWEDDTRVKLVRMALWNLVSPSQYSYPRELYSMLWIAVISLLPMKMVRRSVQTSVSMWSAVKPLLGSMWSAVKPLLGSH